eukprot:CAMPEP_0202922906 /NCGR_PEP_ID=MMETSP1392-20130828/78162_1 /ASSEMBLY_ACC=CAM_ASM_000868 /TAXON_ID=225041 /ORGANISM="Chlamydomonas chlamydogama, Strain SAG 11-48b" /LENGTH=166 /DNA_ID=CAMNT_0049616561 /DNA_START=72 /DNA_END=572 /DNA_ORIENTATION=-
MLTTKTFKPYGTFGSKGFTQKLEGSESLISTWRSKPAGRQFYETQASHKIHMQLTGKNLGPKLLPLLQAGDPDNTGKCTWQHLSKMCLLHFNILLTPASQAFMIAEWQVVDHLTLMVDIVETCALASDDEFFITQLTQGGGAQLQAPGEQQGAPEGEGLVEDAQAQ